MRSENTTRALVLGSYPDANVGREHFRLEELPIPPVGDRQVAVAARYLAIEPLLRGRLMPQDSYARPVQIGEVMTGRAISEVVFSRSPDYAAGDLVEHWLGWREHGVVDASTLTKVRLGNWPVTTTLGALGSSGLSAFLALTKLGRPQAGDTVVVTAASGAVGELVVQIAKLHGCRVIGIAGTDEKCAYVAELGADIAINYKAADFESALSDACGAGVDVFFDSVGGQIHDIVMSRLALHARVVVFGTMDLYSNPASACEAGPRHLRTILVKRAIVSGFLIHDHAHDAPDARATLEKWWSAGRLRAREEVREGLAAAPLALADVIAGHVQGKMLIKVA